MLKVRHIKFGKCLLPFSSYHWSPDGGSMHLWNVGLLQRDYTEQYPRRLSSSNLYFCSLFTNASFRNFYYMASNERVISECWIGNDFEESGRGPVFNTIPLLAPKDWGKPRQTSVVRIVCHRDEIEPRASIIRSVNHSTTTFCRNIYHLQSYLKT
jgi:hypothetical protein